MAIHEGAPMLREVADLCEQCRVRCEQVLARGAAGELARMGPVMLAAASMSRLCADALACCEGLAAGTAMVRVSVRALCGEAARLLSLCAQVCLASADSGRGGSAELRDVALLLVRCADLCALLAGPAKLSGVPVEAPGPVRHEPVATSGSAGVA